VKILKAPLPTVYPRWRGEHGSEDSQGSITYGLSPLARGTPPAPRFYVLSQRFIPAGAGNTDWIKMATNKHPVYPRWRGEHAQGVKGVKLMVGLSPLARGTRKQCGAKRPKQRFIPTGAGNTCAKLSYGVQFSVYPRWRGEHCRISDKSFPRDGLSPLARGTRTKQRLFVDVSRFIPAGAGNTAG